MHVSKSSTVCLGAQLEMKDWHTDEKTLPCLKVLFSAVQSLSMRIKSKTNKINQKEKSSPKKKQTRDKQKRTHGKHERHHTMPGILNFQQK